MLTITTLFLASALAAEKCDTDDLVDTYLAAFNSHDVAVLETVLSEDYFVTSPYGAYDREGWIALSSGAWGAFPDMHWGARQVVREDDRIALEYEFQGTFVNDFLGLPATGQPFAGSGMEINQIDEDTCEIVRTWNYSDAYTLFAQLQG